MKTILKLAFLSAIPLVLSNCKKDKNYQSYFYTDVKSDTPLYLYVDEEYKGKLPVMTVKPTFENDTLKQKALYLTLKTGKYKIEAKDADGSVMSSGTVKFCENKAASTGKAGGQSVDISKDVVIVGLRY